MTNDVERNLAFLPEPVPPDTIRATVMARLARLPDPPAPAVSPAAEPPVNAFPAWAMAFAGLAIVVISWIAGGFETAWWSDFMAAPTAATATTAGPLDRIALLGVASGLGLYLAGLLAPLRRRAFTRDAHRHP